MTRGRPRLEDDSRASVQISARLTPKEHRALLAQCEKLKMVLSDVIRMALKKLLKS